VIRLDGKAQQETAIAATAFWAVHDARRPLFAGWPTESDPWSMREVPAKTGGQVLESSSVIIYEQRRPSLSPEYC